MNTALQILKAERPKRVAAIESAVADLRSLDETIQTLESLASDKVVARVEEARAPRPEPVQPVAAPAVNRVPNPTPAPAIVRAAPSTHTVAEILESAKVPGPHTAHGEVVAWAESVSKGQYLQVEPSDAMLNELREGLRNGKIQPGQTALPTHYEAELIASIPEHEATTPVAAPAQADVAAIDDAEEPWNSGEAPQAPAKPEGEKPKRRSNKKIAEDLGVNLADVVGTGNGGRVTFSDIENHAKAIAEGGQPEAAQQAEEAPAAPQGAPVPQGAPQAAPAAPPAQFGTFPTTPYGAPAAPQSPQFQAPVAQPQAAPQVPPFQAPAGGPPAQFGQGF